jgi:hypothetical protein
MFEWKRPTWRPAMKAQHVPAKAGANGLIACLAILKQFEPILNWSNQFTTPYLPQGSVLLRRSASRK